MYWLSLGMTSITPTTTTCASSAISSFKREPIVPLGFSALRSASYIQLSGLAQKGLAEKAEQGWKLTTAGLQASGQLLAVDFSG
jgi:hypothetical protein